MKYGLNGEDFIFQNKKMKMTFNGEYYILSIRLYLYEEKFIIDLNLDL